MKEYSRPDSASPVGLALVADNDMLSRWSLVRQLRDLGMTVRETETGRDAVRLAEQHRFQLVFIDRGLPDLEYREVVRRIRGLQPGCSVWVMSAYDERTPREQQGREKPGHLDKPVSRETLKDLLP